MNKSESIAKLSEALAAAQGEFPAIPKNKTGKIQGRSKSTGRDYEYSYKYADLSDVLKVTLPVLAKHKIAFLQPTQLVEGKTRVVTMLMHASGEWLCSDGLEIDQDCTPQELGSELTYFKRYDGCSMLGIAPDEDEDGKAATERERKPQSTVSPQRAASTAPAPPSKTISEPQAKRLFAIAKNANASTEDMKRVLTKCGYEHSKDIRMADYEHICELFTSGRWADVSGDPSLITKEDVA